MTAAQTFGTHEQAYEDWQEEHRRDAEAIAREDTACFACCGRTWVAFAASYFVRCDRCHGTGKEPTL